MKLPTGSNLFESRRVNGLTWYQITHNGCGLACDDVCSLVGKSTAVSAGIMFYSGLCAIVDRVLCSGLCAMHIVDSVL